MPCLTLLHHKHLLVRKTDAYWQTGCGMAVLTGDKDIASRFVEAEHDVDCPACKARLAAARE